MFSDLESILKKEGIRSFDKDIRQMPRQELRHHFCFKTTGKVNVTVLIKNLIWQTYTWISQGQIEPIEGNIRSFWYMSVKPVLSRLGLSVSGDRYTERVYDNFIRLITVCRLFRYADLGFIDERLYQRHIGQTHGNLILFVEKDGLFPIVREIAEKYSVTAISLGGFPSYLTTEYLLRNMAEAGLLRDPVHLFGLTDYDPSGYWIEHEFAQQLREYGVELGKVHSVMDPKTLPEELVEIAKYKLTKSAKTDNWVTVTGGIAGEAYGLEADALGGKRIREAYEKAIQPYISQAEPKVFAEIALEKEQWLRWLAEEPGYLGKRK
jgi:hypothetical protein